MIFLRGFRVTGIAFSIDPNGALFADTQDPKFTLYFKNAAGELKHRKYQAHINSIGLKVEFAINVDFIFFINTDLNYFDANTSTPLSWGLEVNLSEIARMIFDAVNEDTKKTPAPAEESLLEGFQRGYRDAIDNYNRKSSFYKVLNWIPINVTYTSFENETGGMLKATMVLGLGWDFLSLVTGGSLEPVEKTIKK